LLDPAPCRISRSLGALGRCRLGRAHLAKRPLCLEYSLVYGVCRGLRLLAGCRLGCSRSRHCGLSLGCLLL
jgi:hypothetical protein